MTMTTMTTTWNDYVPWASVANAKLLNGFLHFGRSSLTRTNTYLVVDVYGMLCVDHGLGASGSSAPAIALRGESRLDAPSHAWVKLVDGLGPDAEDAGASAGLSN